MPGFIPGGMIATAAQAAAAGVRSRPRGTRRSRKRKGSKAGKRSRSSRAGAKRRARNSGGKPRPGTKAWMAYIRGKRGKKKRR